MVAKKGTNITNSKADISGNIPVIAGGKTSPYNHNMYNVEEPCFTISASGANAGYIWFHQKPIWASDCKFLHSRKKEKLLTRFLYELFKVEENNIKNVASGNAQPHVYLKNLSGMKLPLPPIDVQNDIVKRIEEIDSKQKNAGGDLWNVLEEQKIAIINEVWED